MVFSTATNIVAYDKHSMDAFLSERFIYKIYRHNDFHLSVYVNFNRPATVY